MSGGVASAANALDDLLGTLQEGDLSPLELRMLLWLAEGEATQSDLSGVLGAEPGATGRAARRLAMRGLIARRFERGRRSRFVLSITAAGLSAVAPILELLDVGGAGADPRTRFA
jgi:DNA-binding MarR family transcriptional regulator